MMLIAANEPHQPPPRGRDDDGVRFCTNHVAEDKPDRLLSKSIGQHILISSTTAVGMRFLFVL